MIPLLSLALAALAVLPSGAVDNAPPKPAEKHEDGQMRQGVFMIQSEAQIEQLTTGQNRTLNSNGLTAGQGNPELPPVTPPPGPPKPPPPTWEEQEKARAEAYDAVYGKGAYKKLDDLDGNCWAADGCNKMELQNLFTGAQKFVDLTKAAETGNPPKESPDFKARHDEIKQTLGATITALAPGSDATDEYRNHLVGVTKPVVDTVFGADGAKQYAWLGGASSSPDPKTPDKPVSQPPNGLKPGQWPPDFHSARGDSIREQGQTAVGKATREAAGLGSTSLPSAGAGASAAQWLMDGFLSPSGAAGPSVSAAGVSQSQAAAEPAAIAAASPPNAAGPSGAPPAGVARRVAELENSARRSLTVGDARTAAESLREAVAAAPEDPQAFSLLSMAENRLKNYEAALADAQKGLRYAPGSSALLDSEAVAFNGLHRFKEALAATDQAIKANPKDALAWFNRAVALAGMGDRAGMIEALRTAASLSPKFAPFLVAAEQLPAGSLDFQAAWKAQPEPGSAGRAPMSVLSKAALGAAAAALLLVLVAAFSTGGKRPQALAAGAAESASSGVLAGKYEIGRQLGAGGMGVVFEATDRRLGRRVAIKRMREELRFDPRERERFMKEARAVAKLRHPNVVDILEIIEDSGEIYLVFELLSGRNLRDVLSTGGRLALPKARDLFAGVAAAIDYAQSQGVIHRDLKPANVMLDAEGRPRVTDFGIARVTEEAVSRHCATRATTVVGTPLYMAPEQEQGATCTQSDVYSLAVCLYEALTGERPFPGTGAGLLMNKIKKAFKPPTQTAPGLPAGIDAVFDKALDPDPLRRHATAGDLMRDLAAL